MLILLAILPPLLWIGWGKYQAWRAEWERRKAQEVWIDARFGPTSIAIDFAWLIQPQSPNQGPPNAKAELVPPRDPSDLEHGKGP